MMSNILKISTLAIALSISTVAFGGEVTSGATRQDLLNAMKDEAFDHLKYMMYAEQARKNGNAELGAVFERIAAAERDKHFKEHAKYLGLLRSDSENLTDAISGEYLATSKIYPEMANRAKAAGDTEVGQHFAKVGKEEAEHHETFKAALLKRNAQ